MGREAEAQAHFRGATGAVRVLLESDALILRGEVRGRFARAGLSGWRASGDDLVLLAGGEPLILTLGKAEALAWLRALDKPLPTLAQKLGLKGGARAWVLGAAGPQELDHALLDARAGAAGDAAMILAVLAGPSDLELALRAGRDLGLPVWCVYGKGPSAPVGDGTVRAAFRAAGWIDSKSCAVSPVWTATRYHRR